MGLKFPTCREFHRDEKWRMGAEAAFGYTTIDVSDSKMLRGNVNRIIDTYTIPARRGGSGRALSRHV